MRQNKNRGYTLIELMVVVALVGILAAVIVPKLTEVNGRNRLDLVANDVQEVAADTKALAIKTRRAVVMELRDNTMWINQLSGVDCSSAIAERCVQNMGEAMDDNFVNKYSLDNVTNRGLGLAICSRRVAALDAAGNCVVTTLSDGDGVGLCYNGSGQLFVRLGIDGAADCNSSAAVDPGLSWTKACAPFMNPSDSTPENDFSGADIRLQRFKSGAPSCVPGAALSSNAVGLPRQVIIPAGGHPITKIPGV